MVIRVNLYKVVSVVLGTSYALNICQLFLFHFKENYLKISPSFFLSLSTGAPFSFLTFPGQLALLLCMKSNPFPFITFFMLNYFLPETLEIVPLLKHHQFSALSIVLSQVVQS